MKALIVIAACVCMQTLMFGQAQPGAGTGITNSTTITSSNAVVGQLSGFTSGAGDPISTNPQICASPNLNWEYYDTANGNPYKCGTSTAGGYAWSIIFQSSNSGSSVFSGVEGTLPAAPGAGLESMVFDSTYKLLRGIGSAGAWNAVFPNTCTNQVLTGITSGGVLNCTSPQTWLDANGNTMLSFTSTPSAANYFTVTNAISSGGPALGVNAGNMNINVPGTGLFQIEGNGQIVAGFQNPSPSDVDRILFKGGTTGVGPSITVYSSTDTNAPLYLGGLGTGVPELIGTGPIVSEGAAYTYGAGFKQTFAPSSTTAGMQTGCVTADPSSLQLGDLWCNSTNGRLGFYTNATHYFAYTGDSVTAAQLPNSGVHTGDVSGTFPATTVTAINGTSVSISSTSVQKLDGAGHLTNASSPGDFQKVFFHIYDTTQSATQGSTHSQTLASSGLTAGMYQVTLSMEVVTASGTGACTGVGSITTATAANSANTITIGGGANMVSGTAVGTTSQGVFTFYDAGTEATTVSVTWPGTCSTSTVGTYNMGSTLTRLW